MFITRVAAIPMLLLKSLVRMFFRINLRYSSVGSFFWMLLGCSVSVKPIYKPGIIRLGLNSPVNRVMFVMLREQGRFHSRTMVRTTANA